MEIQPSLMPSIDKLRPQESTTGGSLSEGGLKDFTKLLDDARIKQLMPHISTQKSEIWNSLRAVDRAVKAVDADMAAALNAPKPDLVTAHLLNMQLEQKAHVAKMMMNTSVACAGSLKSTLTQLLKNQ